MLDVDTRRRIDTARDILVGKLPDPKSQVEQITIALIYKFMDDMDREALELGGKAKFFTGEYQRYAWSKIFDPSLSGYDLVNVYGEALQKMNLNPNIPQLFRDIFKNAFLPYRDPETLKSFLKTINDFEYDLSEKLGDAFEYLLSVLGSQGEAGQFRTPRHIIDFMVAIVDPKKNESILDPACGTAGFLISSYKHILKHNSGNFDSERDPSAFELHGVRLEEITINSKKYSGDKLTSDDKERLVKNISGYDISPDMVRLSLVNMYLHGFSNPRVFEYDTLTSEEKWNEYADVIMANPPFMSPKGGIRPHKRFSIQSSRSEILFVDYIVEHLNPQGRAAVIVPEGIIFQTQTTHRNLRKMLIEKNYLVGVISLPAGVFNPYSGVKTSILWMDRTLGKKTDNLLFVKIENDGFDLGAQRRPIKQNDLPNAFRAIHEYMKSFDNGKDFDLDKWQDVLIVPKSKIAENDAYNLTAERYKPAPVFTKQKWPLVKLGEISERVTKGTTPTTIGYEFQEAGINFIKIESIDEDGNLLTDKFAHVSEECHSSLQRSQLRKGDVLFSIAGTFGRVAVVPANVLPANTNQALAIITPKKEVLSSYLRMLLASQNIAEVVAGLKVGFAQYNISLNQVSNMEIPLPPLEVQEQIVTELSGYQRIIGGARQVVDNYKPHIDVDPSWPVAKLGELCEVKSGGTPQRNIAEFWGGNIPWVGSTVCKDDVVESADEFITEEGLSNSAAKIFRKGTTLIALVGATIGKTAFLNLDCATNQNITGLYPRDTAQLHPKYLFYITRTLYVDFIKLGEGKFRMANLSFVREREIPIPNIDIQKYIVEQIEKEQGIIKANKQLTVIFEQRVKDRIKRVWGEK